MRYRLLKLLPYVSVLIIFVAVTAFYFAPQFDGKVLQMHDITQYEGMQQDILKHRADYGEDPQWAGNMFGGMPSYLINFKHDGLLMNDLSKALESSWRPASLIFLAMAAFWVMLLLWGVNPWVGLAPSLAYGLSSYMLIIIGAGHITKMVALAYAPLLIGSVYYAFRRNMWIGAALSALFASLEIYANHPQITYYFGFILAAYWINELFSAIKERTLPHFAKVTCVLLAAGALSLGANLSPLWYVQQHAKYTMRGGSELTQPAPGETSIKNGGGLSLDYATMWSYGKMETVNLFIPEFMGGSSSTGFSADGEVAQSLTKYNARNVATQLPAYWGDQPGTAGPTYLGAVVIFLAVLGLYLLRGRSKYWIVIVSAIAIMLAWGKNLMWFTELFFNYFPMYNKFRTVAMILVIVQWSVPFLAAMAIWKVWRREYDVDHVKKAVRNSVIITGGIALLFIVLGGAFFNFSSQYDSQLPQDVVSAAQAERLSMLRSDAWRSLIFVLLSAGVVWLYALGKVKKIWFVLGLSALVCIDLVPVDMRYLPKSSFVNPQQIQIQPTQANIEIMKDSTPGYRVANFTVDPFSDATTSYFHRSVGGYHGAKLQRYQDVISRHLSQMNWRVYSMLNTKYFIVADKQGGQPQVQINPDACGSAWFVDSYVVVDNADQEIAILDTLDTRHVAVLDQRFADQVKEINLTADSTARIELTDYKVNHLTYSYSASQTRLVVFSEIYYDQGWKAYIDGVMQPYFRTDYILRGMILPAGNHTVEFKFAAPDYKTISTITLVCSVVVIILALAAIVVVIVRNRKNELNDECQQPKN